MTENDILSRPGRTRPTTELRFWREINKITQKQMAKWLGTSRPTYLRFESNLHRNAPRDMGLEIRASELTGIPVNELRHTYYERKRVVLRLSDMLSFDTARALADIIPPPPYLKHSIAYSMEVDSVRRRKRRRENQWSDLWSAEKETTSLPKWQKNELDRVEWAVIFEDIRQKCRKSHRKSVTSPRRPDFRVFRAEILDALEKGKPLTPVIESIWQRIESYKKSATRRGNFEAEVKAAIEDYLSRKSSKPLTVLKYNRLDRFWSQQKVATEIGISQPRYSRIEKDVRKATDAELDKLERLFGISKEGLKWPWYTQETPPYRHATEGKNKPEGRRHLSFNEGGRVSRKESRHEKIPWYVLRFRLLIMGLSPFRVLMMHARGDMSELLFRGR